MNAITPEWISAVAVIISLPISIWAILSVRKNSKNIKKITQKLGIKMEGNTIIGSGTMVHIGDKK